MLCVITVRFHCDVANVCEGQCTNISDDAVARRNGVVLFKHVAGGDVLDQ